MQQGPNRETMSTITFDATDPKFQLTDEFKPDKENLWPFPKEKDGWVHAHNALRYEIQSLIEAINATNNRSGKQLKQWEIECITKAWKAHEEHIHAHHSNEDKIMGPYLSTRFHYPDKVRLSNVPYSLTALSTNHMLAYSMNIFLSFFHIMVYSTLPTTMSLC